MKTQLIVLSAVALLSTGCNAAKKEALEGVKEVEAACAEDPKKGNELGQEWYGKNEVFKKGVDGAAETWKVKDVKNFKYCGGPAFIEAKTRMEH